MKWKKISSKYVYKNDWIKVREDKVIRPNGEPGLYSVVETNGPVVMIVAINENGEIFLVRQFRYPSQTDSWEVPGGNAEKDGLEFAAKRELAEETGLISNKVKLVGNFVSMNGISSEIGFVFVAKKLIKTAKHMKEEEGIFDTKWVTLKDAFKMIKENKITDGQSIVAITKTALVLGLI